MYNKKNETISPISSVTYFRFKYPVYFPHYDLSNSKYWINEITKCRFLVNSFLCSYLIISNDQNAMSFKW